jgi:hypothetical protein
MGNACAGSAGQSARATLNNPVDSSLTLQKKDPHPMFRVSDEEVQDLLKQS